MKGWISEFKQSFPSVGVLDGYIIERSGTFWLSDYIRKNLPNTVIMPDSPQILSDMVRWMLQRGITWSTAWSAAALRKSDVYVSMSNAVRFEPILDEESGLVKVDVGTTLGELERFLNRKGFTIGLAGSPATNTSIQQLLSGDSFVEPYISTGYVQNRIVALEGVLHNGFPFKTKVVPRSATGPDFMRLFLGNGASASLIVCVVFRVAKLEFGKPSLWRWLRTDSLEHVVDIMQQLAYGRYPQLAMRAFAIEKDSLELRIGYARNHPLNTPLILKWEDSTPLAKQSGPMECSGDEIVPQVPPADSRWYYFSVMYSALPRFFDILDSCNVELAYELLKPSSNGLLVRVVFAPGSSKKEIQKVMDQLTVIPNSTKLYPIDFTHLDKEVFYQWQKDLII